jgi:hypothetical protein
MKAATLCGHCWTGLQPERETVEQMSVNEGPVYPNGGVASVSRLTIACPKCGKPMMAEAAMCGYCWARV